MESSALHPRSRQYLLLIGFAAAIGVAAAVIALAFLWAQHGLQTVLWEDLPDAIRVDPHPWYAIAVTTLGGLAVGLVLRFAPGHGGPRPAEGHGVGETHIFIGGTMGLMLHELFTSVPLAVAAAAGMVGATMALIRLPIFVILFISFFGGPALVPVIVLAAVTAYVLVFDKPDLSGDPPEASPGGGIGETLGET